MGKKAGKEKREHRQKSNSQLIFKDNSQKNVEKMLIENFVSVQRVMVNLAGKIDNLTTQISKLLELFEISAKALAEKNFQMGDEKGSKKIMEKMDTLLEQNKIIARGLTLMHEINSKPAMSPEYRGESSNPPISSEAGFAGYQKSRTTGENAEFESPISSEAKKFKKLP